MEPQHWGDWLLVVALLIGFSLTNPSVRHLLGPSMARLGNWALTHLGSEPEWDQEADDLYRVLRRQQLFAHVERIRRILLTDESMSATRQIANRLAYGQLLRDLERSPDPYSAMSGQNSVNGWRSSTLPPRADRSRPPTVEILEIGWRR
jgi:hypothetical protein